MRDEHIIEIIESAPLASLSAEETSRVRAHADGCPACRRALDAARLSSLLLSARVEEAEAFEPTPFFQTRVMAALRERQAAGVEWWSFARVWNSARALVSSMAAVVALLAGLTLFGPATQTVATETSADLFSAEEVVLARDDASEEEMTYGQVLTTIYAPAEDETR
ncbi:MAG TPA: zf-HC2 domain-containing protein [Pyrinomonadaceae bacterium]|nr:zf-HC2 domain-containing protein [Pyrinomonadaceae bacterium]